MSERPTPERLRKQAASLRKVADEFLLKFGGRRSYGRDAVRLYVEAEALEAEAQAAETHDNSEKRAGR